MSCLVPMAPTTGAPATSKARTPACGTRAQAAFRKARAAGVGVNTPAARPIPG